jgi:hypothetical protein
MGMLKLEEPVTTVEQLLALPDDGLRHELLDGEHCVTPAPELLHHARLVERWSPGDERPAILRERLVWTPVPGAPPLEIELQSLFSRVHEDTGR